MMKHDICSECIITGIETIYKARSNFHDGVCQKANRVHSAACTMIFERKGNATITIVLKSDSTTNNSITKTKLAASRRTREKARCQAVQRHPLCSARRGCSFCFVSSLVPLIFRSFVRFRRALVCATQWRTCIKTSARSTVKRGFLYNYLSFFNTFDSRYN